eukprot:TRINITY_DN7987_c0_g1_i1.p1 TRINITY_DN7987_c0_g1~~TRINITY_DN7987_c0_g1_i1.p1  ORF type:complete len:102 (-),score=43.58 TRINITY_DN7987_c0_g1_i1:367-672(-)
MSENNSASSNGDKPSSSSEGFLSQALNKRELKVRNIVGSTAGAGSSDFHRYRSIRRFEYARLEAMDKEARERVKHIAFQARREDQKNIEIYQTKKKKREKK